MTREQIEHIVREWQHRLNIPHWRVVIEWDKPTDPEDAFAQISRTGGKYEGAFLQVASNYETWSVRDANEIIVHELMHAVLSDLEAAVTSTEDAMPGAAYKMFAPRFDHELEGVVDRLALLLVKFAGVIDPNPAREETQYVFSAGDQ